MLEFMIGCVIGVVGSFLAPKVIELIRERRDGN